jgi:hypothetical protein
MFHCVMHSHAMLAGRKKQPKANVTALSSMLHVRHCSSAACMNGLAISSAPAVGATMVTAVPRHTCIQAAAAAAAVAGTRLCEVMHSNAQMSIYPAQQVTVPHNMQPLLLQRLRMTIVLNTYCLHPVTHEHC